MTTFDEYAKDHHLMPEELDELGLALKLIRGGCGTVGGKEFPNKELLDEIRNEAFRQEKAGAVRMSEILDCAANKLLAGFIKQFEREQYKQRNGR